jgi:hypothetical protein
MGEAFRPDKPGEKVFYTGESKNSRITVFYLRQLADETANGKRSAKGGQALTGPGGLSGLTIS